MKYTFKTMPDAYQLEALRRALKARRYGIFFQQRVGKTKVAIDFCGVVNLRYGVRKVLVVSPLSARGVWLQQLEEHLNYPYDAMLYPKSQQARAGFSKKYATPEKLLFVVITYETMSNDHEKLKKWAPDVIIFDEVHRLKKASGMRSRRAHKLAEPATFVLGLSGTPAAKKWYDVFGVMRAINASIFGVSYTKFLAEWAIMGGYMGKEPKWCRDGIKLSEVMAKHSMRVLRKDVMEEPQVENVMIPVELERKARLMYNELKKDAITTLDETTDATTIADIAIVLETRLAQLTGGMMPDTEGVMHNVSRAKIDAFEELIRDLVMEDGEPVVVFYRFTAEGDLIRETLERLKVKHAFINGQVKETHRNVAFKDFQSGAIDVIALQISTGSEGIKLDRACINIYYSITYRLFDFLQSRDRVMGRGQKRDVTNYMLAATKTIDEKIVKTLKNDEEITSSISDRFRWLIEED